MRNIIDNERINEINYCEVNNAIHLDLSEGESPFSECNRYNNKYFINVHNNTIRIL